MAWVKICGMTSLEDARTAVEVGADAVGFVFWEQSPRNIDPEIARQIVSQLPAHVEKIGVFVNQFSEAIRTAQQVGLTAIQVHRTPGEPHSSGNVDWIKSADGLGELKLYMVLRAESLNGMGDAAEEMNEPWRAARAIFIDSGTSQQPGGTGKMWDWDGLGSKIAALSARRKIVIAGGLTPENVADAIGRFKPFGVDVSSGVERAPGKKDPGKVRAFVQAVRAIGKSS